MHELIHKLYIHYAVYRCYLGIMWKIMHNHLESDLTEQKDCIDKWPWEKEQEPLIHACFDR